MGRRLVPLLVAGGYQVVAMTRSPNKTTTLRDLGAEPVVADGLDRASVLRAVGQAEPEVVIHQMTGLAGTSSFKRFDEEFALTNRLRTEGVDYLLEAARAAGVRDEPAPVATWLPALAKAVGAKPPWRVPVWLGRLAAGEAGVSLFTRIRGASNAKAKRELGWQLRYPSWREGFRLGLAETPIKPTS